jgi:CheY-like chemotaxis protein
MSASSLEGRTILVVEDDPRIAGEIAMALEDRGASVVGPCSGIREAIAAIGEAHELSGAVLDVNLSGELVFPVAYDLARRAVPFVFLTGYDRSLVAVRFSSVPAFEKPVRPEDVVEALATEMQTVPQRRSA